VHKHTLCRTLGAIYSITELAIRAMLAAGLESFSKNDNGKYLMSEKKPTEEAIAKARKLVEKFTVKSGTTTHPDKEVTESVVLGLADNIDTLGKPLCPCRFYPDKKEEVTHRTWICACDDMQIYKYCHCLLFVREDGRPITEYLPPDHDGRKAYGLVEDPTPDKGRALRDKAAEREKERIERPS
jgi:ferredoxin-thioredoxin reductase catalytic chain